MRLLTSLLLPALALAAPAITLPRQTADPLITIASVNASGPGCPPGTFSTTISPEGTVVTYGFDSYQTSVGPGSSPQDREKYCELSLVVVFPLGCTTATFETTYHGFVELETGVSGTFSSQYNISPGATTPNPPPTTFTSAQWSTGGVYTKTDATAVVANIPNASQKNVSFLARTRVVLQPVNQNVFGLLTDDDATISITQAKSCFA